MDTLYEVSEMSVALTVRTQMADLRLWRVGCYIPVISSGKIESSTSRSSIWSSRPIVADPPADWRGRNWGGEAQMLWENCAKVIGGLRGSEANESQDKIREECNIMSTLRRNLDAKQASCQSCGPTCKPVKQPLQIFGCGASTFFCSLKISATIVI